MDDYDKYDCEKQCRAFLPFLAKQHIEANNSRSEYFSDKLERDQWKSLIEKENNIWSAISNSLDKNHPKFKKLTEIGNKLTNTIIAKIKNKEKEEIAKAKKLAEKFIFAEEQTKYKLLLTRSLRFEEEIKNSINTVLGDDYYTMAKLSENAWRKKLIEYEARLQQENKPTTRKIKTEQQKLLERKNDILTSINKNFLMRKPATEEQQKQDKLQLRFNNNRRKEFIKRDLQNSKNSYLNRYKKSLELH